MASTELNPCDLLPDLIDLGSHFLQQSSEVAFHLNQHLPITLVMAFDAPFLNRIESILLFSRHATMAIDTFDHIQLIAWSLLNADAPFPLNQSFDGDMAVFTFDLFDLLPMMTICTILLKSFSVIFTGRMAVRTFQSIASHMGLMRKFDIVKGNGPFLHPHMAEGRTGHLGLKFLGLITFINDCQGLFSLIIGCIEKFEGIFDIVNALAQKNKAVIVAGFIEKVLGLLKICRASFGLFRIIEDLLNIEDPLIGLILCF